MEQNKVQIMMEEYKVLRSQIQQSMQNRNSILTFGLSILGVVLYAGVSTLLSQSQISQVLAFFIFSSIMPTLSLLVLVLWCSESEMMGRIGGYLLDFENRINNIHREKLLYWEDWLRECDKRGKMTHKILYLYYVVGALFVGFASVSLTFILLYSTVDISVKNVPVRVIVEIVMYVMIITVPLWILWRYERGKTLFNYP